MIAGRAGSEGRTVDGCIVAVDVGGTFTDVTVADPRTGAMSSVKIATTADDPSAGFAEGIRLALEAATLAPESVERVLHATTIATNAVLEATGARAGLICTRGFRHVLEIGRHDGPRRTSLHHWVKPDRPIPPDRIFEIAELVTHEGDVELSPTDVDIRAAAERLRGAGVTSVAVALINAYANADNERRIRAVIQEALPGVPISISSDILPVFREYERTMATALNAYVWPLVSRYVERLAGRLADLGVHASLLIMQSNGGLDRAATVVERPAWTVLSGPAAGVLGATEVARSAGFADVISLDVGGTSSDVALVRESEPQLTFEGSVGPWPLSLPMVDVHTIGAGGGSIARVDADGGLHVGPGSAGARPGPACYGLGGRLATVTDAQVVMGRLPDRLADGAVLLDRAAAFVAIQSHVAEPLGLDPEEAAWGIVEVADHSIAAAVRLISTERGLDPREHVLVAGGGAGPLHAANVAVLLEMTTVLVPRRPGVLSTIGLLVGDLRREFLRTSVCVLEAQSPSAIRQLFRDLERDASAWFVKTGVGREQRRIGWSVSLRYPEQASELTIGWPRVGRAGRPEIEQVVSAFHARHLERYGYHLPHSPVEMVSVRVEAEAEARTRMPELRSGDAGGPTRRVRRRTRPVYLGRERGSTDARVIDRRTLRPGSRFDGPAIVEQLDSTVYVPPDHRVRTDHIGNLLVTRAKPP